MAKEDKSSNLQAKLKAIEIIVSELNKLSDEDRSEVLDFALKQVSVKQVNLPDASGASIQKGGGDLPKPTSIDRFVSEKNPADQYQQVAVLAFYLKEYENNREFKNKDITAANIAARQTAIGNPADAICKAETRYGFLTKGTTRGTRQLSTLGERVVEAFPNQEEVTTVIKNSRTKVRRRKKVAKKPRKAK